jgi:hypothetical protein
MVKAGDSYGAFGRGGPRYRQGPVAQSGAPEEDVGVLLTGTRRRWNDINQAILSC